MSRISALDEIEETTKEIRKKMRLPRGAIAAGLLQLCLIGMACSAEKTTDNVPAGAAPQASPVASVAFAGPVALEGFHDIASCDGIVGWVWDARNPQRELTVEICDGDRVVATAVANTPRQDLLAAGRGTGKYGFTVPIPADFKDGITHSVKVKVQGNDFVLGNSPKFLRCPKS